MTRHHIVTFTLMTFMFGACGGRSHLRVLSVDGGADGPRSGDAGTELGSRDASDANQPERGSDAARDIATREARGDVGADLPASLLEIEIAPPLVTIGVDIPFTGFVVTALYADGSTMNVTADATWTSSDASVAQVSGHTVVGKKAGTIDVLARYQGQTATAKVTVTASPLLTITIDGASTVPVGHSILLGATGVYADGSKQDVTGAATWEVSNTGTATLAFDVATGKERLTGVKAGSASVTASLAGVTGKTAFQVTAGVMTRIDLTPAQPILQQGLVVPFQATATYSDGTTADVTSRATWSSSDDAVASVHRGDAGVIVEAIGPGTTVITAALEDINGAIHGATTVTVTNPTLVSILLSPSSWRASVGRTQAFTAFGDYSDGSRGDVTLAATWSSDDLGVVSVSNAPGGKGGATALGVGAATISAALAGIAGSAKVTVNDAPLVRIDVSPDPQTVVLGLKAQMVATGTFQDRTTPDLTAQVAWSVSDPSIATVSNHPESAGQVTGIGVGSTTVIASYGGMSGKATLIVSKTKLLSIAVDPPSANVTAGVKKAFRAKAAFDDGTTQDLTTQVSWASTDLAVAQISNAAGSQGVATSLVPGATTITASLNGISGSATLTVGDPLLASLMILPATASVWIGNTQTFTVTAVYQNGTSGVAEGEWSSSNPAVATITTRNGGQRGVATGIAPGSTTITVAHEGKSASASLTVTAEATLIGLSIVPSDPPVLLVGTSQRFQAMAIWNNGSTTTVTGSATWASSDSEIATVSNGGGGSGPAGWVRAVGPGSATLTAAYEGFVATVVVSTRDPMVTGLDVTPGTAIVAVGETQQFQARASYEDGTTSVVTNRASWVVSDGATASITSGGFGRRGRATGISAGIAIVTASYEGFSATAGLTVSDATSAKLVVTPATASIQVGQVQAFVATLVMSDNTTLEVTRQASWSSSDGEVATVVTSGSGTAGRNVGNAVGASVGGTTITASYEGITGSAALTVTDPPIAFVQVTPSNPSLPVDGNMQFMAIAVFTDNTTRDVTGQATWSSSDSGVALVGSSGSRAGRVTALGAGKTTITATYEDASGSTVLAVAESVAAVDVTPTSPTVVLGVPVQLSATALLSNGATLPVTGSASWVSSDDAVVTVTSDGLVTPLSPGTASITATYLGKSGVSTLVVSAATLNEVAISPSPVALPVGGSQLLLATGTYADGSTHDLTGAATWLSSDASVASVSNAAGSKGLLTGIAAGTATVTAVFGGVGSTPDVVTVSATP